MTSASSSCRRDPNGPDCARDLVMQIGNVSFAHVPREKNNYADRLSNVGMDANGGSFRRSTSAWPRCVSMRASTERIRSLHYRAVLSVTFR